MVPYNVDVRDGVRGHLLVRGDCGGGHEGGVRDEDHGSASHLNLDWTASD
jgi:hypothetical protein